MTGADVRPATPADIARVLVLWRTVADNGGRPPDTETALVALLECDPSALLVAESGIPARRLGDRGVGRVAWAFTTDG